MKKLLQRSLFAVLFTVMSFAAFAGNHVAPVLINPTIYSGNPFNSILPIGGQPTAGTLLSNYGFVGQEQYYGTNPCVTFTKCYGFVASPTNPAYQVLELEYNYNNFDGNNIVNTDRNEINIPNWADLIKVGSRWYAWNFYVPSTWVTPSGGVIFAQIHGTNAAGGVNPVFAVGVGGLGARNPTAYRGNNMFLAAQWDVNPVASETYGNSGIVNVNLGNLQTGQWYLLVANITWSNAATSGTTTCGGGANNTACFFGQSVVASTPPAPVAGQGQITVWLNNKVIWSQYNYPNNYDNTGTYASGNYTKTGEYIFFQSATVNLTYIGSGGTPGNYTFSTAGNGAGFTGGGCSTPMDGTFTIGAGGTVTGVHINNGGIGCKNTPTTNVSFGTSGVGIWSGGTAATATVVTPDEYTLSKGTIEASGNATYWQVINQFLPFAEFGSFIPSPVIDFYCDNGYGGWC